MRLSGVFSVAVVAVLASSGLGASVASSTSEQSRRSSSDAEWCNDVGDGGRDERYCEVRELTMAAPSTFEVTVGNGSVALQGGSRRDLYVRARVVASARTMADAKALAGQVNVRPQGGRLEADGPRTEDHKSWWVSYRIDGPSQLNLRAEASNGSVSIDGVRGTISAETDNGSVRLSDVGGNVKARTSNGSVTIDLNGSSWNGDGLDAVTSNGSLRVSMPRDYNAHLVASTENGTMRINRPVTVQGRIGKDIDTNLGRGGATLRFRTANGSLSIGEK